MADRYTEGGFFAPFDRHDSSELVSYGSELVLNDDGTGYRRIISFLYADHHIDVPMEGTLKQWEEAVMSAKREMKEHDRLHRPDFPRERNVEGVLGMVEPQCPFCYGRGERSRNGREWFTCDRCYGEGYLPKYAWRKLSR